MTNRYSPLSKFASAFDPKSGQVVTFLQIRNEFFKAAQEPNAKRSIKDLRQKYNGLSCPHCKKAELVFSFGSQNPDGSIRNIAGSNVPGQPAHLKTKANSTHSKGCIATVFEQESLHPIDQNKGYKIFLNFKEVADRNPRNGQLVWRSDGGKIVQGDKDLHGRETVALFAAKDILPLLHKGEFERVNKSIVVYGNTKISWPNFFIHRQLENDADKRVRDFSQKILNRDSNARHPILVSLQFNSQTSVSTYNNSMGMTRNYSFAPITGVKDKSGKAVVIEPRLFIPNHHLFDTLQTIHQKHGEIFVLVENPNILPEGNNSNRMVWGMTLEDPDMMCEASLKEIRTIAKERAANRNNILSNQTARPA